MRGNLALTSSEYETGCVHAALRTLWPPEFEQAYIELPVLTDFA